MGTWDWKSIVKAVVVVAVFTAAVAVTVSSLGTATAAIIATATAISGASNIAEQIKKTPKDQEIDYLEVKIATISGGARATLSALFPGFLGTVESSAVSGFENLYKENKKGVLSKEQKERAFSEAFTWSSVSYGIGGLLIPFLIRKFLVK